MRSIHLTGILLLAPHLTEENHEDLLARAQFRSKRDIQKLIGKECPRPDVPALIEPLGPQQQLSNRAPTWSTFVESFAGPVRDIPSGNGPGQAPVAPQEETFAAPPASASDAPARPDDPPQRWRIQFTAEQRYVDLLEEARDLLQHQIHDRNIADVHLRAMEALVEKLRKQRCRATDRPRAGKEAPASAGKELQASDATARNEAPDQRDATARNEAPEQHDAPARQEVADSTAPARNEDPAAKRSRHVPAAVVREVWARDGGQCTFVDERGAAP